MRKAQEELKKEVFHKYCRSIYLASIDSIQALLKIEMIGMTKWQVTRKRHGYESKAYN